MTLNLAFGRKIHRIRATLALFIMLALPQTYAQDNDLLMATTTSTENSGLLAYLLPYFEQQSGIQVKTIATGTGKALRLGQSGDVDILLVHAPKSEQAFIEANYGINHTPVMFNDFILVGPEHDPANLKTAENTAMAFNRIKQTKALFISRGDDSGTHKKERELWQSSDINPTQLDWYRETGQGMGRTLLIADQLQGYTLVDRGTWLSMKDKITLKPVFVGADSLVNPYALITVNPEQHEINLNAANLFTDWMKHPDTQQLIADYTVDGETLFHPIRDDS